MSQLWACGPVIPGLLSCWPELGPTGVRVGSLQQPVFRYGDEYYFYFDGQARTSLTKRWRALFSQYLQLQGHEPSGFLINLSTLIGPGNRCRDTQTRDMTIPEGYGTTEKQQSKQFIYIKISDGSWNGPGEELYGS